MKVLWIITEEVQTCKERIRTKTARHCRTKTSTVSGIHTQPSSARTVLYRVKAPECVCSFAGAVFVTDESVQAGGTEPVLAAGALKALVAQTGPVDVVTLGPVLTVTLVGTLRPVGADRAFILASGSVSKQKWI